MSQKVLFLLPIQTAAWLSVFLKPLCTDAQRKKYCRVGKREQEIRAGEMSGWVHIVVGVLIWTPFTLVQGLMHCFTCALKGRQVIM